MPSYKNMKKEIVLEAIKDSQGIVSTIAKKLNCDFHTAERLVQRWEETQQAYENECNFMLDLAESKIHKAINGGDVPTCKWYLTMKGKKRGYETTPTIKLDNSDPLNINFSGADKETIAADPTVEVNDAE